MYKKILMIIGLLWMVACTQNKPEPEVKIAPKVEEKVELKTKVEEVVKKEVKVEVKEAVEPQIMTEEVEEFIPEHLRHSKIEVVKHY